MRRVAAGEVWVLAWHLSFASARSMEADDGGTMFEAASEAGAENLGAGTDGEGDVFKLIFFLLALFVPVGVIGFFAYKLIQNLKDKEKKKEEKKKLKQQKKKK